jgi:uncharacterized membrane protein YqjE
MRRAMQHISLLSAIAVVGAAAVLVAAAIRTFDFLVTVVFWSRSRLVQMHQKARAARFRCRP